MSRRILLAAPWLPWPADFGGAARVYHLARGLARQHDVTLLAPATEGDASASAALGEWCDVVAVPARWTARQPAGRAKRLLQARALASRRAFVELATHDARFQAAIERLFQTRHYDLVQLEFPQLARYRWPAEVPRVLDAHNVEHELLLRVARESVSLEQRVFNLGEARKVRSLERAAWRSAALVVATSARDADAIARLSAAATRVVPNGVDTAAFAHWQRAPRPARIVFVGAMRHAPNASGALWLVERVLPLLRARLPAVSVALVGADPPPAVRALVAADVQVTGHVDDVRPWLAAASVAAVPLHAGGGTRLKILEAFAAGVAVVSTRLGAEGLDVTDGEHLLLADTHQAFAAALERVLTDPALAARLAAAGAELARKRYDWERVTPLLDAAHDEALALHALSFRPKRGI